MRKSRSIFVTVVMILLVGVISADAASLGVTAANAPWTVQILDGDEPNVKNLSTAFVGLNEVPMMSWSKTGLHNIYQAHLATDAISGDCGPNDAWYCTHWDDQDLVPGKVSNMATFRYGPDTFGVKWVYLTSEGTLRGASIELWNDMRFVGDSWEDLVDLNKFGGILVGEPSLEVVGGWYRLAAVVRSGGDFPEHKLVYMYKTGTQNTSCKTSGTSLYQCDVIDFSTGYDSMGSPSLQVVDGTVGIAYYKNSHIMYAYPWEGTLFKMASCPSTGEDTYRCIPIWDEGTAGKNVSLAFGPTSSDRGIAFTNDDEFMDALYVAEYVGSGGNCGVDGHTLTFPSDPIESWKCSVIYGTGVMPEILDTSFSIDIDPDGFPVVAFQKDDILMLANPKERLGISDPGWATQEIDGNEWSNTGTQNALSINSVGLGFIGYMQPKYMKCSSGNLCYNDPDPNLKMALQWLKTYLPLIMR